MAVPRCEPGGDDERAGVCGRESQNFHQAWEDRQAWKFPRRVCSAQHNEVGERARLCTRAQESHSCRAQFGGRLIQGENNILSTPLAYVHC